MTDLERRALLGDQQAQEECTRQGIVLRCPFCGSLSEIHEAEAISEYATYKKDIPRNARFLRQVIYPSGRKYYEYRRKTFIPKCCETSCPGRIQKQYRTREQAISAWNTRPAPPIGRCEECDLWCEEQGICTAASDDDLGIYEYTEPDHFCGYFKQKDGEENG